MHVMDYPEMKALPFGKEMAVRKLKKIWGDRQWWEKLNMKDNDRAALLSYLKLKHSSWYQSSCFLLLLHRL
ncbi:hypothetical protein MA16_Dca000446 [Dendrobium catenatum]|uniref:Uncharacterized protein n=1 Tax=Dendrobium catenatum TaxID=906689 RepID=A0A2I0WTV7_9ASPA|nr:hypothetical protein MA16_Dca000446 [Dendrobium catenatum]